MQDADCRQLHDRITRAETVSEERWRAHGVQHEQEQRAEGIAGEIVKERLERLNELRAEVLSDRAQFVGREYFDTKHEDSESRIRKVEQWKENIEGRLAALALLPFLLSLAALMVSIWVAFGSGG